MNSDFESARCVIAGRTVTITSWCDQLARTWSASAPAYRHLLTSAEKTAVISPSRSAAVARVAEFLKGHFATSRA